MRESPQEKGGRASMESQKVSAAQIQMYLKGISYPADKRKVVDRAKMNKAPENVMSFLNRLPDRTYSAPNEIQKEFGKMK